MTNPQKIKGSSYERDNVHYWNEQGFSVERTRVGWSDDRGDIHGIHNPSGKPFTIECKNHKRIDLAGWVKELCVEIENAGAEMGAVIHKKQGTTDVGEHYATLKVWMLARLLKEAGYR